MNECNRTSHSHNLSQRKPNQNVPREIFLICILIILLEKSFYFEVYTGEGVALSFIFLSERFVCAGEGGETMKTGQKIF